MTVEHPGRRPPIEVAVPAAQAGERFAGNRVKADRRLLDVLGQVCDQVETSPEALLAASRDWWPMALHWALAGETEARPAVVVAPSSTDQVSAVVRACHERSVPVTVAGGRSGVTGAAVPVFGGVALDLTRMAGVAAVDAASGLVTAWAGTIGSELEEELARDHRLTLGHWPQSIELSTLGGWLACRAAGQYSTRYGKIEDIVAGLEVVLADGRVVRTGAMAGAGPRSATGPDLNQLFVGSEGTLGVITRAVVRGHPLPLAERRAAWVFPSFADGLEALRRTLRRGATPAVLRLHDATEAARSWGVANGHLLIALDEGDERVVDAAMDVLAEECAGAIAADPAVVGRWLERRNDVSELTEVTKLGVVADTVEVSAPWSALPDLYQETLAALAGLPGCLYASAHASHSYLDGGCLYFTFAGQGTTAGEGDGEGRGDGLAGREAFYRAAWDAVMGSVRRHGGSISHHHGIGLVRGGYLAEALGEGFDVLVALKRALDPKGILNPGKLGLPGPFGPPPWP